MSFVLFVPLCTRYLLLRYAEMLVVHRDIVLPLFGNVILRKDGRNWTSRLASPTVDAFFRMDVQHRRSFKFGFVLLRMDAIHRTRIDTRSILRADAGFANDVCHRVSLWNVNAGKRN